MTQGRPKGSKAEIEIAKLLEPWWSTFEPFDANGNPIRFVRTPLSGGWGSKDTRAGFKTSGDLMSTAVKFPFVVEVKRREGWSWKPFLNGKKSPVWAWWLQACKAAAEQDGCPLLVFRKNREPWHAILPVMAYVRAPGPGGVKGRCKAWYPDELEGRAGVHIPAMISMDYFLAHEPKSWIRAIAAWKTSGECSVSGGE